MTKIEDQLRQELAEVAQRATPAGLRPLGEPLPRPTLSRSRLLVPVTAAVAVVLVLAGLTLAGRSLPPRHHSAGTSESQSAARSAAEGLPDFAVLQSRALTLFSPVTGKAVWSVPAAGMAGQFAVAPDSKTVYVTRSINGQPQISSISVRTGKVSFVADGLQPSVSPDSRYLAYVTGAQYSRLAIRDLATGTTRSIDLTVRLGNSRLLNGQLTWFANGTQVVILPRPDATSLANASGSSSASNACGQRHPRRSFCLLVVNTGGARLQANRIIVSYTGLNTADVLSQAVMISGLVLSPGTPAGYDQRMHTVILATTAVVRSPLYVMVTLVGDQPGAEGDVYLPVPRLATLAAIAPDAGGVVYLMPRTGHSRPSVWVAEVGGTDSHAWDVVRHRVPLDAAKGSFSGAAW